MDFQEGLQAHASNNQNEMLERMAHQVAEKMMCTSLLLLLRCAHLSFSCCDVHISPLAVMVDETRVQSNKGAADLSSEMG